MNFLDNINNNNDLIILYLFLTIGVFTSLKAVVSASPIVGSAISTVTVTETETVTLPAETVYIPPTSVPQPSLGDVISISNESSYLVTVVLLAFATISAVYCYRYLYIYKMSFTSSLLYVSGGGSVCVALLINIISSHLAHLSTNALTIIFAQNFLFELIYFFLELHYLSLHINITLYYLLSLLYHFLESLPFLGYFGDDGLHITR